MFGYINAQRICKKKKKKKKKACLHSHARRTNIYRDREKEASKWETTCKRRDKSSVSIPTCAGEKRTKRAKAKRLFRWSCINQDDK
ncbi:hypothetical protein POVWA2_042230 [Plasmodium ovale wallikeri]|uniref:Uncharacterized protein n=1 Tax=Plasmodium ovale wallikeri TaxID=864142 RepID=A0A1A8ZCM7_PLAOA|nr:hypothetical protein POVWA2_042230 [Plasmodium ovale wallikeri]